MKIWILQTGEPLYIDKSGLRPMRAMNLSNALMNLIQVFFIIMQLRLLQQI